MCLALFTALGPCERSSAFTCQQGLHAHNAVSVASAVCSKKIDGDEGGNGGSSLLKGPGKGMFVQRCGQEEEANSK